MEKFWKRLLSTVLSVSMLISMLPSAHALETEGDGRSYFDFEASEYEVRENDGELKVKIVRHGEGKEAADVSFKAADFLSAYGTDYDVLGMDGEPLEKVSGEKPDPSEFVYDDDTDSTEPVTEEVPQNEGAEETPQNEGTGEASQDEGTEEAPQAESTEETPQNKDTEAEDEPAPEDEPP